MYFLGPVYLVARREVVVPRLDDKLIWDTRRDEDEIEHLLKREEQVHLLEFGHIVREVDVVTREGRTYVGKGQRRSKGATYRRRKRTPSVDLGGDAACLPVDLYLVASLKKEALTEDIVVV